MVVVLATCHEGFDYDHETAKDTLAHNLGLPFIELLRCLRLRRCWRPKWHNRPLARVKSSSESTPQLRKG